MLQTQIRREWLRTQGGKDWLRTQDGRDWLMNKDGLNWLQTQGGLDWLPMHTQDERDTPFIPQLPSERESLGNQGRQVWPHTQSEGCIPRMGDIPQPQSREWSNTQGRGDWMQPGGWQDWLSSGEWLQTPAGQLWIQIQGKHWLQIQSGQDWLRTRCGGDWLQTQSGEDWLQSQDGRVWRQTQGGRDVLQTKAGLDSTLDTPRGREYLKHQRPGGWLYSQGGDWLQTQGGRDWLQTLDGQAYQSTCVERLSIDFFAPPTFRSKDFASWDSILPKTPPSVIDGDVAQLTVQAAVSLTIHP